MVQEIEIEKSLTDYKTYRILSLENELKVVLISDIKPETDSKSNDDNECSDEEDNDGVQKSAAALCISTGSFDDPEDLQGLAHYLEHMVFMGSTKYPLENDFDSCVKQHGGSSNAWTDNERTLFYFDSHFNHFEKILDKFANFFISPILLKDSMDRELVAVNSEFEMSYSNDSLRAETLLQILSKNNSPYRTFQYGNTKSLRDDPMAKNIDIYNYLHEFRLKTYTSHWMTLAIQSRDTLDNLEKMVRSIFSDIPHNHLPKRDMSQFSEPFNIPEFNRFYSVVPVKDIKSVKLSWSLPPQLPHYKSKSIHFLGHLVGYEGPGSLTAYLRRLNYIVELEAGNSNDGFDSTSFNSLFMISAQLTENGFENLTEIIRVIFSYLEVLKSGIPERIFNEYRQIRYNEFLFKEPEEPVEVVESLAVNLQLYEPQHIISGPDIVYEYRDELCQDILSRLSVDTMNLMVSSKSHDTIATETTDWYNVRYSVRDFTENELDQWRNPCKIDQLHLPFENKFIATSFDLLPVAELEEVPVNIVDTIYPDLAQYGEIWYMLDPKFRVPKAIANFYLWSPIIADNPLNMCMLDIFLYAVNQQLSLVAYDASVAGLDYRIYFLDSGLMIKIDGFNDKVTLLFSTIIDFLRDFLIDSAKLTVYKESIRKIYRNLALKPNKLADCIHKKILYPREWLVTERLEVLKGISLNDLKEFHTQIFQTMRIKSYFHGNISLESAKQCFMYCIDNLKLQPSANISKSILRSVPVGENRIRVMNMNPQDVNTVVTIEYQIGPGTIHDQVLNEFLSHILSEPCFDFLRSKETLGYVVDISDHKKLGILGMTLYVMSMSTKFSIAHCNEKMDYFFDTMARSVLESMPEDDFNDYKASFMSNKMIEDIQMSCIESRNWREIFQQELVFDRRFRHLDVMEEVTKADLLQFYLDKYQNKSEQRKLIIEVDAKEKSDHSAILNNNIDDDGLYEMKLMFLDDNGSSANETRNIDTVITNMSVFKPHLINM